MEKKNYPGLKVCRAIKIDINTIAIFIAVLQLIIAMPQLKLAYDSCTSSDIDKLNKTIKGIQEENKRLNIVNIPKDITDEKLLMIDSIQYELYLYTRTLADFDTKEYKGTDKDVMEFEALRYKQLLDYNFQIYTTCQRIKSLFSKDNNTLLVMSIRIDSFDSILKILQDLSVKKENADLDDYQKILYSAEFRQYIEMQCDLVFKFIELLNLCKIQQMHNLQIPTVN